MREGHEGAARLLVRLGADYRTTMSDGWTCLHYAVNYTHPALVEFLLSLHPDLINSKTAEDGHSPLHKAMYQALLPSKLSPEEKRDRLSKQLEVIRILLRFGANVDTLDNFHFVPLHLAVKMGRPEFVSLLRERGARVDIKNHSHRTPVEYGKYWAERMPAKDKRKEGILAVLQLLENPTSSPFHVRRTLTFSFRSRTVFSSQSLRNLQKAFLDGVQGGITRETLLMARALEEKLNTHKKREQFWESYVEIYKNWKLPLPHLKQGASVDYNDLQSPQAILTRAQAQPHTSTFDKLACLLIIAIHPTALLGHIKDTVTRSSPPSQDNLNAVWALLAHFRGHEALVARDFPKNICSAISKVLGKPKREDAKKRAAKAVLDNAEKAFPSSLNKHDENIKQIYHKRRKLNLQMRAIFEKERSRERNELIDRISLHFIQWHRECLIQTPLRDFRHIFDSSYEDPFSFLSRLEKSSKQLTANILIFLLSEEEIERRVRCLEFVIDWMSRCLLYGDFHQAYSLYQALTHSSVLRLRKTLKKLSKNTMEMWKQCEKLFSPNSHFENYSSHLMGSLTPLIPAFGILSQQLGAESSLTSRYLMLRYFQELRQFSQLLVLPKLDEDSEFFLFFSQALYPKEWNANFNQKDAILGTACASKRSCELEQPRI